MKRYRQHRNQKSRRTYQRRDERAVGQTANICNDSCPLSIQSLPQSYISAVERQKVAAEMGSTHGNRLLQRMIQRDTENSDFQLRPPGELSLPEKGGVGLDVGTLNLDPSLIEELPIQSTVLPDQILRPSPALFQQLINEWQLQYQLLHPGPQPHQNEWQQLWRAWRQASNSWLNQEPSALLDRAQAERELRDKVTEAVLQQFSDKQSDTGSSVNVGKIAAKVGEALQKALDRTEFYGKWKQTIENYAKEHWQAVFPLLGGAMAHSLGTGEWRATAFAVNKLHPLLNPLIGDVIPWFNQEFKLTDDLSVTFRFSDSPAISSTPEGDAVFHIRPALILKFGKCELSGSGNVWLNTGQGTPHGFQAEGGGELQLKIPLP